MLKLLKIHYSIIISVFKSQPQEKEYRFECTPKLMVMKTVGSLDLVKALVADHIKIIGATLDIVISQQDIHTDWFANAPMVTDGTAATSKFKGGHTAKGLRQEKHVTNMLKSVEVYSKSCDSEIDIIKIGKEIIYRFF